MVLLIKSTVHQVLFFLTKLMIDKLLLIKLNQDNQACFKKPIQSDVDNLIMQRASHAQKPTRMYSLRIKVYFTLKDKKMCK